MYKGKPGVLCIQETMLPNQKNNSLNYNELFKEGQANYWAYGGVAIFIQETIPTKKLPLSTPLQALAARINIGRQVNIVSIYNSRSRDISGKLLSTFSQQLHKPVTSTGDFNSYHQAWRKHLNDNKACQTLNLILSSKTN